VNSSHSDTIEIGSAVRTVVREWRIIAGVTIAALLAAGALILFAPKKYTGESTVVLKAGAPTGGSSLLAQVTGLGDAASLLGGKTPMETELEILSSRAVVGQVLDSLLLQARVIDGPRVAARDLFTQVDAPGSFKRFRVHFERVAGSDAYEVRAPGGVSRASPGIPASVGAARFTLAKGGVQPSSFTVEIRDREDAIERVSKHLDVSKEKGEVASVTYKGDDSVTAARVPNLLLAVYFDRRRGADRGVNQRRVEFLTAKSDSMTVALSDAAGALRRQQEASGVIDAGAVAKVSLESAAELRGKLTDVLVEQGALGQLMSQIAARTLNPRQLAAYPAFLKSPAVNDIIKQLGDVETQRTVLLQRRTESDPEVQALTKSAENLEQQLVPYAKTYADALSRERSDLERTLASVEQGIQRLPKAAESAGQLQIQVEDLAKLGAGLQAQLVEAKLAAIGEGGDVRVLDTAMVPKKPSFPDPPITIAVALFSGLLFGTISALLAGALGRWVRDPIEVERETGVPVLQFDPSAPLLLANDVLRTMVVAPVESSFSAEAVVNRLARTAASRSISAVVFVPDIQGGNVNATIAKLESENELVIVQLPSLTSESAAATLRSNRPVVLVTEGARVDRRRLGHALQLLRRLEVPCAGIVMTAAPALHDARAVLAPAISG
jgi:tyrosine-protein kinase Etk/Wzc